MKSRPKKEPETCPNKATSGRTNTMTDNDPNTAYYRFRSDIPLDDQGIENARSLERIADFIKQVQERKRDFRAIVFGCVLEDSQYITAPNGKDANATCLGTGELETQLELLDYLFDQITADD